MFSRSFTKGSSTIRAFLMVSYGVLSHITTILTGGEVLAKVRSISNTKVSSKHRGSVHYTQ